MTTAWTPDTIDALQVAVHSGVLVEGHHVDFKREVAVGAVGTKSLAKDLAAFAVDGGQIIIGVDENDHGPPTGGVRLFAGRATDIVGDAARFMDVVVAGLILRVVETARTVADTAGFFGSWQFGAALTNMRGAVSHEASMNFMAHPSGFSESTYRRTCAATYEDLTADVVAVTSMLASPLLRGFQSPFDLNSLRTHRS